MPLQPRELEGARGADLLVGIPSYNNAATVGHVARAVQAGLAKYFPDHPAILFNSDGGSTDGTAQVVQGARLGDLSPLLIRHQVSPLHKFSAAYAGIPGKGSAFRAIFEAAAALEVKACAVVDADLRNITPEWVELLLKPVLEGGFDFVAPLYRRHKFDGTITNAIVYPLTRALYGARLRQPIGGDFGFSGRLASLLLEKKVWDTDVARYGIDIWMTTTALASGMRVCQAFLGAKIHDPKDPGSQLLPMFQQVVGSAFALMEEHERVWLPLEGSREVPSFGFQYEVGVEPVKVDLAGMLDRFRLAVANLAEIWEEVLPREIIGGYREAAQAGWESFTLPDLLWTRTVYHFAAAWKRRRPSREILLSSLVPLYLARTAAFVVRHRDSDPGEVEEGIEQLCRVFEAEKPYLGALWAAEGR